MKWLKALLALACLAVITLPAVAYASHLGVQSTAYTGSASRLPGWDASGPYDNQLCDTYHTESWATIIDGFGRYVTIAIIDGSGGWNRSAQSQYDVSVQISPNTLSHAMSFNKKAYCRNSGSSSATIQCGRAYWDRPHHASCA